MSNIENKIKCSDCKNEDLQLIDVIIDFGSEIGEVKFGCKKCFEMFILTYEELEGTGCDLEKECIEIEDLLQVRNDFQEFLNNVDLLQALE